MNAPVSVTRLEEIRARLNAATPGPWRTSWRGIDPDVVSIEGGICHAEDCDCDGPDLVLAEADAAFIAHAPEDIAFLLARVAALKAALAPLAAQDCESWGCLHALDNHDARTCVIERARAALKAVEP